MNHAKLLYIEDDRECDMCDKKGVCAILDSLGGDILVMCKDCLKDILKKMEE